VHHSLTFCFSFVFLYFIVLCFMAAVCQLF